MFIYRGLLSRSESRIQTLGYTSNAIYESNKVQRSEDNVWFGKTNSGNHTIPFRSFEVRLFLCFLTDQIIMK